MNSWLCVAIGGAFGSMVRYAFTLYDGFNSRTFPVATFLVNIIGCFFIGVVLNTLLQMPSDAPKQWLKLLLVTGFAGGLTTFSTLTFELVMLWKQNPPYWAFIYLGASIGLGLLAVVLGMALADKGIF